ncbi:MAG: UDP-glucose 4-epimerase GalE [Candidatus Paceibacterota bacterium]
MAEKRVLVTGGAGYIGSAVVAALCERGDTVVVFDDLSSGQREKVHTDAQFIEGDITDQEALAAVFERPFDAVLHFAAKKSVAESETNPTAYFHTNVVGALNLLACMERHEVPTIVFSSTAAVYKPGYERCPEAAEVGPVNVYGCTKLMVEECIREYHRTGVLKRYGVLRYFNVAGDVGLRYIEQNAKNVFPILARAVQSGDPFRIFGTDYSTKDGTCVRDYIHLVDLVDAHLRVLDHDDSGTYNLGTEDGYSVRELVRAFEEVSGKVVSVEEAPRRAGDPACLVADAVRARTELGWRPTKSLTDMVESTVSVYKTANP